jgi:hypothetical protein
MWSSIATGDPKRYKQQYKCNPTLRPLSAHRRPCALPAVGIPFDSLPLPLPFLTVLHAQAGPQPPSTGRSPAIHRRDILERKIPPPEGPTERAALLHQIIFMIIRPSDSRAVHLHGQTRSPTWMISALLAHALASFRVTLDDLRVSMEFAGMICSFLLPFPQRLLHNVPVGPWPCVLTSRYYVGPFHA